MRDPDVKTDWHAQETYKGLIEISLSGLRFSIFSNGGAALALLAFLGQASVTAISLAAAKQAIAIFIIGVALGGAAHVTSYLTQLQLYGESALGSPEKGLFRHRNLLYLTVFLVALSIVAFAVGALSGVSAIQPGTR